MCFLRLSVLFTASLALLPATASAEERGRPGRRDCVLRVAIADVVPAHVEGSWWLAGGGGFVDLPGERRGLGLIGAGTEWTFGLAQIGSLRQYGGPFELRWGPWAMGYTDFSGGRGEGGLLLSVGQVRHAQWGTYALRIGGGYGDDTLGAHPHLVATLTGGMRYVPARDRGVTSLCSRPTPPETFAFASGMRLFATMRSTLRDDHVVQFTFGLELEPTFLFPPYSLGKLFGAVP